MDFYISPEEYERAAANGVSYRQLNWRIREAVWDKEKAITTPPRKLTDRSKWRKIAEENGISRELFYVRVINQGWDSQRAATTPLPTAEEKTASMRRAMDSRRVNPPEFIALAQENGIPYKTFNWRVKHGWGYERAATTPITPRSDVGRKGKERTQERYGDINRLAFQKRG